MDGKELLPTLGITKGYDIWDCIVDMVLRPPFEHVPLQTVEVTMPNVKKFKADKYVKYDASKNKSTCLISSCRKQLCGKKSSNIKRHYRLAHEKDDWSDESDCSLPSTPKQKLSSTLRRREFLECCLGMVTVKNIPLRIFDDTDFFKKLIEPYEKHFAVNLTARKMGLVIEDACQNIVSVISDDIKDKFICLKIDIASRMERSILGINIQYIKNFKICIYTLDMIELTKRHTAQNLKEEILKCLDQYGINIKQIYSSTTDNGANVLNLSKLLQEMNGDDLSAEDSVYAEDVMSDHDGNRCLEIEQQLASVLSVVRCAAHSIQLAAHDVLKGLQSEVDECRSIIKKIRSTIRENANISLPILDNLTRWNSTYKMIKSILQHKNFMENMDSEFDINWSFIDNFIEAFKPLADCIQKLQTEQYVIGDFYRDWLVCELQLRKTTNNPYALALHNAMERRREQLMGNDAFVAAVYLDPRINFKNTPLLNIAQKKRAVAHLLKINAIVNDCPIVPDQSYNSTIDMQNDDLPTSLKEASEFEILLEHVQKHGIITPATEIEKQLELLCECEMVPFKVDILQFWKDRYRHYVKLSKVAEVVLAVPATQVSMERAFSALATTLTKSRTRLSNKMQSNILMTKFNFNVLQRCSSNLEHLFEK